MLLLLVLLLLLKNVVKDSGLAHNFHLTAHSEAKLPRHLHVVHFIGNSVMTVGFQHFRVMNQEDTGKLERVADDPTYAVGKVHAVANLTLPDFHSKQLSEFPALQGKGAIEFPFRIADAMFILRSQPGEKLLCLLFVAHVHERNLRSRCGDLRSFLANVEDCRRTIRSTKVAKKD